MESKDQLPVNDRKEEGESMGWWIFRGVMAAIAAGLMAYDPEEGGGGGW